MEIFPPLFLTPPSNMSRAQKKVNKKSNMKEDESVLLVYLLIIFIYGWPALVQTTIFQP